VTRSFPAGMDRFLQDSPRVRRSVRTLVKRLDAARVPYAILGGIALNAHGLRGWTEDVDVLLPPEGWDTFRRVFVPGEYEPVAERPRCFLDRWNRVRIDVRVTGCFARGVKTMAYPEPRSVAKVLHGINVVTLPALVALKLSQGRFRDLADVISLVRLHGLGETFAEVLPPAVREDYAACLDARRREDENNARPGLCT
jgi:hypothetical protein